MRLGFDVDGDSWYNAWVISQAPIGDEENQVSRLESLQRQMSLVERLAKHIREQKRSVTKKPMTRGMPMAEYDSESFGF